MLSLLMLVACGQDPVTEARFEGQEPGDCTDEADNDADGAFDCDDDGCAGSTSCDGDGEPTENTAPTGGSLAIVPAAPLAGEALGCLVVEPAGDAEGDSVSWVYTWTSDLGGSEVGPLLPGGVTVDGETWTCTGVPSDGQATGPKAETSVTVGGANEAPGAPGISVSPATPSFSQDLTCAIESPAVDPDGDTVYYAYAWWVDGVDAGVAQPVLPASNTTSEEVWTCVVTPTDGTAIGSPAEASVTILQEPCYAISLDAPEARVSLQPEGFGLEWSHWTFEFWFKVHGAFEGGDEAVLWQINEDEQISAATCRLSEGALVCSTQYNDEPDTAIEVAAEEVDDGQWHHAAFLFQSSGGARGAGRLFLDGVMVDEISGRYSELGFSPTSLGAPAGGGAAAAPVILGPTRFSSTVRYSSSFSPQLSWSVDSHTVAQYLTGEGLDNTVLNDEAGGENEGTAYASVSPAGVCE